ncbi:MAG: class I tRNA ligase family protein, partial [Candidatus Micrarchaeota archaeon]|nr:class I tRNA ligase family protein [Candidatus Micrarchaeota archaeon]
DVYKRQVKEKLMSQGMAISIYDIQNGPVYSRYGGLVGVKIVKDQWFIDYGNSEWKALAHRCLSGMRVLPEKIRKDCEYTIGWLKEKACTRSAGLGTRFPFDESKMIEALSDSTIYTAYYTISHIAQGMPPEQLTEELFDYVFLGKGDPSSLPPQASQMREQFLYWYPLDSRHSANDLVHNHLAFFIFNHVAIFPPKHWPRQIITNGFVLMDGKKMSKSMGNILPLHYAINEFGADVIRLLVVSGADLAQDTDFNRPAAEGVIARLKFLQSAMEKYASIPDEGEKDIADRWILSRMHKRALAADELYQNFQLRELSLELFYNTVHDLQWYLKRASKPQLREFFEMWVPLIAPFMPYIAEEMWERLGKKHYVEDAPFVSIAPLPAGNPAKVDEGLEKAEEYIVHLKEDISSILKILRMEKPSRIEIFVASEWKRRLRKIAAAEKKFDAAMKAAMAEPELKQHAGEVAKVLAAYMKNAASLGETPSLQFELGALESAIKLLESEFCAAVSFCMEEETQHPKAKNALPGKPSILVS